MKKIRQQEIQPMLLEILRAFDQYCKQHKLQFYLAGGTLLGAVRHQGFIPWDDDVDLFIKEETYLRLREQILADPYIDPEKRYRLLLPASRENIYPFIKLVDTHTVVYEQNVSRDHARGLWVDIFIMTNWPDTEEAAEAYLRKQRRLLPFWELAVCGNFSSWKYRLIYSFAWLPRKIMLALGMDAEYWGQKILAIHAEPSSFIGNYHWARDLQERYPRSWYEKTVLLPFEGLLLEAPAEYDKVLTQFYGEYMKLPPVDQRVRHDFEAYYQEKWETADEENG